MPDDTLSEEIGALYRDANAYIYSEVLDDQQRRKLVTNLTSAQKRLTKDIEQRRTTYPNELNAEQSGKIAAKREEIENDPAYKRAYEAQRANQQEFEKYRQANGGGFPRNIPTTLYIIPLLLIGLAEWYVNFSTFSAMFIPVFAIAATVIVAAVFAWASHLHGAYLKQISEISHPSVEYRNVLGRKVVLIIATILLIAALITVVWLRWLVISEQLGTNATVDAGTFGGSTSTMVWSKVGPTIIVNLLIWGLGTLYSWAMHEKVPGLRESYRSYLRASRAAEKKRRPFVLEEKRLKAQYDRDRERNNVAINEYTTLLEQVRSSVERLTGSQTT